MMAACMKAFFFLMTSSILSSCLTCSVRAVSALYSRMHVYNSDALLMPPTHSRSKRPPCCLFHHIHSLYTIRSLSHLHVTFVLTGPPSRFVHKYAAHNETLKRICTKLFLSCFIRFKFFIAFKTV